MPFIGEVREKRGKGVGDRNLESSAERASIAAFSIRPSISGGLPLMIRTFWALPPDNHCGACHYLIGF
jgi:hypothetical protein